MYQFINKASVQKDKAQDKIFQLHYPSPSPYEKINKYITEVPECIKSVTKAADQGPSQIQSPKQIHGPQRSAAFLTIYFLIKAVEQKKCQLYSIFL